MFQNKEHLKCAGIHVAPVISHNALAITKQSLAINTCWTKVGHGTTSRVWLRCLLCQSHPSLCIGLLARGFVICNCSCNSTGWSTPISKICKAAFSPRVSCHAHRVLSWRLSQNQHNKSMDNVTLLTNPRCIDSHTYRVLLHKTIHQTLWSRDPVTFGLTVHLWLI